MTAIKSLFFLLLLTSIISCGKSEDKAPDVVASTGAKQVIYIKGDIEAMYAGATLNKESFITEENARSFNDYARISYREFKNFGLETSKEDQEKFNNLKAEELEKVLKKGQESANKNVEDETQLKHSFVQSRKNNDWIYSDTKGGLGLVFKNNKGRLELSKIKFKGDEKNPDGYDMEVIHYSVSPDKSNFSILMKPKVNGDLEYLVSMKFSKTTKKKLTKESRSKKFQYLLGPTKRAVIDKGAEVSLCGPAKNWMRDGIENAVGKWQEYLPEGQIKFTTKSNFPPFSDVNSKCIYIIEDYAFNHSSHGRVTLGMVIFGINNRTREIVDTDMFISSAEWSRFLEGRGHGDIDNPDQDGVDEFELTAIHEFGHLLGLAHAFSEDDEHNHISIMNYSDKKKFTEFDIESIKNLYEDFYE